MSVDSKCYYPAKRDVCDVHGNRKKEKALEEVRNRNVRDHYCTESTSHDGLINWVPSCKFHS